VPTDFKLPELGENIASGDVLRVLVKPGDAIAKEQAVLELETDKATIEVPSSVAGQVKDIKVKPGDKVKVGQTILTVDDARDAGAAAPAQKPAERTQPAEAKAGVPQAQQAAGANAAAKVPKDTDDLEQHVEGTRRESSSDKAGMMRPQGESQKVVDITRGQRPSQEPPAAPDLPPAPAAPSVRRMARELGVDINGVPGSGPSGRISIDDVKAHARDLVSGAGAAAAVKSVALPDFSRWGEIDRQPMRAVRRKTAEHLAEAWATIPHVTQHDQADVTALESLRKQYAKEAEAAGGHLTVTAIALKVVASALKVFPQFNSSIDVAGEQIIYKKYVHIGVAVDTDRGLLVPVVRDVDTKNILQISVELAQLSEKARNRKLSLEEMQGGCFSVSNLGGIGGTAFTPIVNAPEVAILGISRASIQPKWTGDTGGERGPATGEFAPRLMLPLSLSYDHRAIDGADGARFLRWVAGALEQPFLLALHG
jgi:pyruvate dehydrogenase E2 component (dihydrolipoyllysine-residue acetyltransferase)